MEILKEKDDLSPHLEWVLKVMKTQLLVPESTVSFGPNFQGPSVWRWGMRCAID